MLGACLGLTISAGLIALVLISSHKMEVTAYPLPQRAFPVSILLANLVSSANLCLAVDTSQGYAVKLKELQFDLDVTSRIHRTGCWADETGGYPERPAQEAGGAGRGCNWVMVGTGVR